MGQPRALPDAVILGAQKSGTSSLHNYLVQHPGVIEPLRKEVHYFDVAYERGEAWYRAHFGPLGDPGLNLDSSPYYLFHPAVPQRLHDLLPDAKLIVLLRDPVRRAYSHYWHERDKKRETLGFEDAIAAEPERLGDAHQQLAAGTLQRSHAHQHFSYLARGRYAEQLERWFTLFPREQFLVLRFEDLAREPLARIEPDARLPRPAAGHRGEPRGAQHAPVPAAGGGDGSATARGVRAAQPAPRAAAWPVVRLVACGGAVRRAPCVRDGDAANRRR